MKRYRIYVLVAALVIFAAAILLTHTTTTDSVKIGFIGPLSGDFAVYGDIEKNVTQIAVDEINKSGGIHGRTLEVAYEDDKCVGANAISAARKLIDSRGIKILLVTCSQSVLPLASIAEKEHVLVFAAYAAASNITGSSEYVFRNAYSNRDIAQTAAATIFKNYPAVSMITEVSEYPASFHDDFKSAYTSLGGKIMSDENFLGNDKNFNSIVAKVLAQKPAAILVNPSSDVTGIPLLKGLRVLGYSGLIFGNFFGSSKKVQSVPEAQGMIYFADPVVADSPKKAQLLAEYHSLYGTYPDYEYPAAARYDSVYILKRAIESVGQDAEAIKDYLHKMPDFSGALGTYRFDENGDVTNVKPAVNQIKAGTAVKYSS